MVRMGNVWDRAAEVLNGRGGMLAGIVVLTLFVPNAIGAAIKAYAGGGTTALLVGALVALAATVIAIWGQLAIIAASTDPAIDRAGAIAQANARLPAALGVGVVLAIVLLLLFLPAGGLLVRGGVDWGAMAAGVPSTPSAPGAVALAGLYTVVLGIALLFVGARLLPLYAVVLHERLGLGAVARCWRLTRHHTWRLVGVILLFLVVLLVATWAAQAVTGLVFRLALGAEAQATVVLLAALAAQAVSAGFSLIAIVFSAQLYVALVARERAATELPA